MASSLTKLIGQVSLKCVIPPRLTSGVLSRASVSSGSQWSSTNFGDGKVHASAMASASGMASSSNASPSLVNSGATPSFLTISGAPLTKNSAPFTGNADLMNDVTSQDSQWPRRTRLFPANSSSVCHVISSASSASSFLYYHHHHHHRHHHHHHQSVREFSSSTRLCRTHFSRRRAQEENERTRDLGTRGELSMTQAQELPALELKLTQSSTKDDQKEEESEAPARVRQRPVDWMPRPEDYEFVYTNGKKFKELPIIFLNADKNNTKLSMTDARETPKAYTSAGVEGFKGCKRGTNIAAQTSAMSFAKRLVRQSKVTHVRVVVKGIGPGRLSAIEGLVMGGLNVVSITDATPTFGLDQGQGPGPRPRKVRRV